MRTVEGTSEAGRPVEPRGILAGPLRGLSVGSVLLVALFAFEGLGVTTVAPAIAADLGGIAGYGWIFTGFLGGQIAGTLLAGQWADRGRLRHVFALAGLSFAVGLVAAVAATSMTVLVAGRLAQGFGAGAMITAVYAMLGSVYPDRLRPRMLAALSSAFVLPALVGPAIAAVVAERFGWRLVFGGMLAVCAVVGAAVFRPFARLSERSAAEPPDQPDQLDRSRRRALGPLLAAAREAAPVLLARGLLVAAFFHSQTYLVLALTELGGFRPTVAGVAVSAGSLSWTAGAWSAERLDARYRGTRRASRVLAGSACTAAAVTALTGLVAAGGSGAVAAVVAGWVLAGFGIGLLHSTTGAIALAAQSDGATGTASSALILVDLLTPAASIGVGSALVAVSVGSAAGVAAGITAALTLGAAMAVAGLVPAWRLARPKQHELV
jgi:predicted MFS family arabinose efflux permease